MNPTEEEKVKNEESEIVKDTVKEVNSLTKEIKEPINPIEKKEISDFGDDLSSNFEEKIKNEESEILRTELNELSDSSSYKSQEKKEKKEKKTSESESVLMITDEKDERKTDETCSFEQFDSNEIENIKNVESEILKSELNEAKSPIKEKNETELNLKKEE